MISLFRYLLFFLLLFVCAGLFAYCVPSLRPVHLSSEGVGGGEYDDYSEGEGDEDEDCEEEDDEECEEEEDQDVDDMDMPYDIKVDAASYLSCDSKKLPDAAFSFKMEALDGGVLGAGVRLRQKFGKMEKDEIRQYPYYRSYPALTAIPNSWWVHPSNSSSNPMPSRSLSLPSIELEDYLDEFLEKKEAFTDSFGRDRIEMGWKANMNLKYSFNSLFESRYLLLTFYRSGRENGLLGYRDMEDKRETTHGRYYRIDMEKQEQYYTLDGITERYPVGRRNSSQKDYLWSCGLQLKVRRHDRHRYLGDSLSEEPGCEHSDDGGSLYEVVQQVLGDDWNINLGARCISLKNHRESCYRFTHSPHRSSRGTNSGKGRVDFSDDCTTTDITRLCPHYLSLCTRVRY